MERGRLRVGGGWRIVLHRGKGLVYVAGQGNPSLSLLAC